MFCPLVRFCRKGTFPAIFSRSCSPTSLLLGHKGFCDRALAHKSWTLSFLPCDRAMIMLWDHIVTLPWPFASSISLGEVGDL
jgi:hypothetical protein